MPVVNCKANLESCHHGAGMLLPVEGGVIEADVRVLVLVGFWGITGVHFIIIEFYIHFDVLYVCLTIKKIKCFYVFSTCLGRIRSILQNWKQRLKMGKNFSH